jgi:hypothetical protein
MLSALPSPRVVAWATTTVTAAAVILAGAAPAYASPGAVDAITAAHAGTGARVAPYAALFDAPAGARPLPAAPTDALVAAASGLSGALGLTQNAGPAIRAAGLSDAVAGRLANTLTGLLACHQITAAHFAALPAGGLAAALATGAGVNPAARDELRGCAETTWRDTIALQRAIEAEAPAGMAAAACEPLAADSLDIWPVLRLETGCGNNTYPNDYLLLVDVGGNDTYRNNVGGNMVDINFAPAGAAVPGLRGTGPARGCQRAIPGLTAADCVPTAAVLLDMQGEDTYGVKETPDHDTGCTNDPVVRRMMTGGAGFLGVSVLRDAGGTADSYTGKTGALGAGHIFGVGVLSDTGGDDVYSAVRNSQGFALVGGFGLLHDEAGQDRYDFYLPAPINPSAPNQTEGAGGVRDDEGEGLCDRIPRFTQGAGNVLPGTVGVLADDAGADSYHGAFVTEFVAPAQPLSVRAGSMGFGNNVGAGVFLDRGAAADTYAADGEPAVSGVPPRGNNTVVQPGSDATGAGAGAGLFIDQ